LNAGSSANTGLTFDASGNATVTGGAITAGNTAPSVLNRVINGDMRLDQRNAGVVPITVGNIGPSAAASAYGPDRFQLATGAGSGIVAAQQVSLSAADQAAIGGASTKATVIAPAVQPDITVGLTSWFPFDNSTADTMNVINMSGSVQYVTSGNPVGAAAAYFNNTAGAAATYRLTGSIALGGSPIFTTSCWVLFKDIQSNCTVFGFGNGAVTNVNLVCASTSSIKFQFYDSGNGDHSFGTTTIAPNTWYHCVLVYVSGSVCSAYVNGVLVGTNTATSALLHSNITGVALGTIQHGNVFALNGYIDDFRIYNRPLSAYDVASLYAYTGPSMVQLTSSLSSGLVAHIPFEGNSIVDIAGGATGATWTGTPIYSAGKVGSTALDLRANPNGTTAVTYVDYAISVPSAFTVSLWINTTSVTGANIFNFGQGVSVGFVIGINAGTTYAGGFISSANGTFVNVNGSTITANTWTHLAATMSSTPAFAGAITIYVNGVQAGTGAFGTGYIGYGGVAVTKLRLGSHVNNDGAFPGQIDDFRIYNRVITAAEIALLANNAPNIPIPMPLPVNTSISGLVSQYPFENSLQDIAGTNTLTLTGTAQYGTGIIGSKAFYFANEANTSATGSAQTFPANYLTSTYNCPPNFSVAMWFKLTVSTGNNTLFCTNKVPANLTGAVNLLTSPGNLYAAFNNVAGTASYPVSANTWYHTVLTYANGVLSLYVNGASVGASITSTYATNGFIIGGTQDANSKFPFAGYIDDFRLYAKAMSATEVTSLYAACLPNAATDGLIMRFPFENSIADIQGTNNLTMTGTAQYVTGIVGSKALYLANEANVLATPTAASNNASVNYTVRSALTMSAWIYYTKITSGTPNCILEFGTALSENFQILSTYSTATTSSIYAWAGNSTSSTLVNTNTWIHVTATYVPSTSCTFYVNGSLVGTVTTSIAATSGTLFKIGDSTQTSLKRPFAGYIDDFRLYAKALSATEVASLFTTSQYAMNQASSYVLYQQPIESRNLADFQWGTSNATPATVSAWIKNNTAAAQQFALSLRSANNGRSVVYNTPAIPAASWRRVAFSVPGDTTGTYANDNTTGLTLGLCLGAAPAYATSNVCAASNNAASVWNNGAFFTGTGVQVSSSIPASFSNNFLANPANSILVTGVQLEKGTVMSPFEIQPIASQLTAAQRYFEKSYAQTDAVAVAAITINNAIGWSYQAASKPSYGVSYKTTKRAIPAVTVYNPANGAAASARNIDASTNGAVVVERSGDTGFGVYTTVAGSLGQTMMAHYTADAEL
jgi:hypothetical protein